MRVDRRKQLIMWNKKFEELLNHNDEEQTVNLCWGVDRTVELVRPAYSKKH